MDILQCKKCGYVAKTKMGLKQHKQVHKEKLDKRTQTNRQPILIVPKPENTWMRNQAQRTFSALVAGTWNVDCRYWPTSVILRDTRYPYDSHG
jgi:hypothetical protein